jgi:hypothetical protein
MVSIAQVDASPISGISDALGSSPVDTITKGLKLKDLITENQVASLELNQAKQQQKDQADVKKILSGRKLNNSQDVSEAAAALSQAGHADEALKLMGHAQNIQSGEDAHRREAMTLHATINSTINDEVGGIIASVKAQTENPDGTPIKNANGTDRYDTATKNAMVMGAFAKAQAALLADPDLDDKVKAGVRAASARFLQNGPPTWDTIQKVFSVTAEGRKLHEQELRDAGITSEIKHRKVEEAQREEEIEIKRHPKAPSGFEWDPEHPDQLRKIKGGPRDEAVANWSGRAKVFAERVITSANEAGMALENVVKLPVGASTGVLGVGSSPGHNILAAPIDALRNKVSSQDVQDYNVMIAGVRRNLATIETTGLVPSGAFTEGFAAVELREGDTELTKMRKLAESRQIVDAGLEVQLADPAIPPDMKAVIQKTLDRIHTAIPFTHADVTAYENASRKNKKLTLNDFMEQKGLKPGGKNPNVLRFDSQGNPIE